MLRDVNLVASIIRDCRARFDKTTWPVPSTMRGVSQFQVVAKRSGDMAMLLIMASVFRREEKGVIDALTRLVSWGDLLKDDVKVENRETLLKQLSNSIDLVKCMQTITLGQVIEVCSKWENQEENKLENRMEASNLMKTCTTAVEKHKKTVLKTVRDIAEFGKEIIGEN